MLAPVHKIEPQSWMAKSETTAVLAALAGGEGAITALFVGGCVRNMLLGYPVTDIDIATVWTSEEVVAKFEAAGIKAIPTGIEHGTVTAIKNKKSYEITTLRRDVATDGRRAVVAFTDDWREDALRRDFTVNTLLADPRGNIYDPTGEGWRDLQQRRIVFVGDPAERIAEDYLRILRFFRFYAWYGEGGPDPKALGACRKAASKIKELSRERITQEFLKLLAAEEPVSVLQVMFENRIMDDLPAAGYCSATLFTLCEMQGRHNAVNVIARLVVLAAFLEDYLETFERYLILSNAEKKEFFTLIEAVSNINDTSRNEIKRLVYRYGNAMALQAFMLFLAWDDEEYEEALAFVQSWQAPEFPLSGDDVLAAGVEKGPQVGKILAEVERWWIEKDFQPDLWACLEKLKALLVKAI